MKSIRLISYICVVATVLSLAGCRSSRRVVRGNEAVSTTAGGLDRSRPDTRKMQGEDKKLVDEALTWLGTPYRYGGSDYNGTDCSGLTMEVYRKALGIKIPRSSREQQQFCKSISKGALMIGDLVFFSTGRDKNRVSHVGMYVGDGKIVHASGSKGVIISNMGSAIMRAHTIRRDMSGAHRISIATITRIRKRNRWLRPRHRLQNLR